LGSDFGKSAKGTKKKTDFGIEKMTTVALLAFILLCDFHKLVLRKFGRVPHLGVKVSGHLLDLFSCTESTDYQQEKLKNILV
jgi:hypothetical protein